MLNNFWGRFGMRENLTQTKFCKKLEEVNCLLSDESVEVKGVRILTEDIVQVMYQKKSLEFVPGTNATNIYIAAVTTAWARIRLYRIMRHVNQRVLYCDTDSIIYEASQNEDENLPCGAFLGELTNELKPNEKIAEFVSGGPKTYGYRTSLGNTVVKMKGFTMNAVNSQAMNFPSLLEVVLKSYEEGDVDDYKGVHQDFPSRAKKVVVLREEVRKLLKEEHDKLGCDAPSAVTNNVAISCYTPHRLVRKNFKIETKCEQKVYVSQFDKRIPLSNYDTLPYGYSIDC
jgi:hypothetical protein